MARTRNIASEQAVIAAYGRAGTAIDAAKRDHKRGGSMTNWHTLSPGAKAAFLEVRKNLVEALFALDEILAEEMPEGTPAA